MKARVEPETDIARYGAWDASRQALVLPEHMGVAEDESIAEDTTKAALFVINTGADGSDAVDVYVDEEVPAPQRAEFRQVGEECLLALPTGKLIIDGLEYYRASPKAFIPESIIEVPAGDYGVTCFYNKDEEVSGAQPTAETLRTAVGEEDHQYYVTVQKRAYLGCLSLLLIPALWPLVGWKWALGITLGVAIIWSHLHEWRLKRDARYQMILRKRMEFWKKTAASGPATMLLVLRKVTAPSGLSGGSVHLGAPG